MSKNFFEKFSSETLNMLLSNKEYFFLSNFMNLSLDVELKENKTEKTEIKEKLKDDLNQAKQYFDKIFQSMD
mgnify:CR=1 FL=1